MQWKLKYARYDTSRWSQPAVDVIPAVEVIQFVGAIPLRIALLLPNAG
jgi:hypothetical protein